MQRSRLQRDVLRLYRQLMRACDGKPPSTRESVRASFREHAAGARRSNVLYIEWLMRRGKRQLHYLRNADKVSKI